MWAFLIKQMGTKRTLLGELLLIIPPDCSIRAGGDKCFLAPRFVWVDEHNAVFSF